jgi:predicted NBD/HSP70 family sugar kinase
VDLTGQVDSFASTPLPPQANPAHIIDAICKGISTLNSIDPKRTLGVGTALTGIVTRHTGIWHSAIHFPAILDVPIMAEISNRTGLPVLVDNDARASLWSAVWFDPRLTECRHVIYLSLCGGIGSALMIEGNPYPGAHQWAGELGHMRAGTEGRICFCGKTDCIETYCSLPALQGDILQVMPELAPLNDALSVANAIRRYPAAAAVAERAMERLGALLGTLTAYVDPDRILLGNQAPELYQALLPSLHFHLHNQFQGRGTLNLPIEIVSDAIVSPLRGMAGLVLNEVFQDSLSPFNQRRSPFRNHSHTSSSPSLNTCNNPSDEP